MFLGLLDPKSEVWIRILLWIRIRISVKSDQAVGFCQQCCGSESGSTGSTCFWASWILSQRYGSGSCSGSGSEFLLNLIRQSAFVSSVADPNPDPPDPYVIGPPGSGAISQRYGSGSEFL
jgi:hypothetical protein